MSISRHYILYMLLSAMMLGATNAKAQEIEMVKSMEPTFLRSLMYDVYVYAGGCYKSHVNLWTARNDNNRNTKDLYDTFADIGIEAEAYMKKNALLKLGASLGYKYERYAYDAGLSTNEGILTHWLTPSINVNYNFIGIGLHLGMLSDIYLGSRTKTNDFVSYEGLNSDCFNRASLAWFFGMSYNFNRIRLEGRIGSYLTPQLDPQKISYYNLTKTYVNGSFMEIRLAWRLFTTGSHYSSTFIDY